MIQMFYLTVRLPEASEAVVFHFSHILLKFDIPVRERLLRRLAAGHTLDDVAEQERQAEEEKMRLERERKLQEAMLGIKQKFGKNAILSGGSYMEGATARERNGQIGGHKA